MTTRNPSHSDNSTSSSESSFSHYAPSSLDRTNTPPPSPPPVHQITQAIQHSRIRKSRRNNRLLLAHRSNRITHRLPQHSQPSPSHPTPIQNALSIQALHHIQSLSAEQRTAERYITALYHLDTIRPIAAHHFDSVAHALVIHPGELRRLFALHTFITAAEPKSVVGHTLPFRRIVSGHVTEPSLHAAPYKTHADLVSKLAHRFANASPMKGATVREARDALSAAAWSGMARRHAVMRMLRGRERVGAIREEGKYVECEGSGNEEEEECCAQYLGIVRELPDTEAIPKDVLDEIARKVEDFATVLRRAPCTQRVEDAFEVVRKSRRFEWERGGKTLMRRYRVGGMWLMNGYGRNEYGVWNLPDGPSRVAYRMALYRTEAMKWMADFMVSRDLAVEKAQFRRVLREEMFSKAGVSVHPFVERLLLGMFSSIEDVAEDLSRLGYFRELVGMEGRMKILKVVAEMQITALLGMMVCKDPKVARELICRFRSARQVARCSLDNLEQAYGDYERAHQIIQLVHGYHRGYFVALMGRVKLPYLVGRVLHREVGDVCSYREAGFSTAMGKSSRTHDTDERLRKKCELLLTEDERIAAYEALHANEKGHSSTAWERFEVSWGVFQLVCGFVGVRDAVDVTCRLLDEEKTGIGVLRKLKCESVERICTSVNELCADDAVRLKTFASNFVESGGC